MKSTRARGRLPPASTVAFLLALSCLFNGCFSGATFQTPVPVPTDEYAPGFGFTVIPEKGPAPFPELSLRTGFLKNADVGIKVTGYPVRMGGCSADFKVRLVERPVSLAVVLGGTLLRIERGEISDDQLDLQPLGEVDTYICPYGMLILGGDHYYFGVKSMTLLSYWYDDEQIPAVFLGFSVGGQDRILPEITYIFQGQDKPIVLVGLGFQWNLKHPATP
ncbi:hypothetical protein ACFL5M_00240 [Candidatus Neomarinimicrobiota bacterium]